MRNQLLIIACVLLIGCASVPSGPPSVGSTDWYNAKVSELDASLEKKEITKSEYLDLKARAEDTNAKYRSAIIGGMYSGMKRY